MPFLPAGFLLTVNRQREDGKGDEDDGRTEQEQGNHRTHSRCLSQSGRGLIDSEQLACPLDDGLDFVMESLMHHTESA